MHVGAAYHGQREIRGEGGQLETCSGFREGGGVLTRADLAFVVLEAGCKCDLSGVKYFMPLLCKRAWSMKG